MLPEIQCARDIWLLVRQYGFLPLFRSRIPGFSIEDCTPPRLWFSDTEPGPWEWKGPVIRMGGCVYGKFFSGKAGYISLEWFPDFANFRRDGYDFDARWDDGLASMKDRQVYEAVADSAPILTGDLKRRCGYGPQGNKGFEGVITRLQMQTYVVVDDFAYAKDKLGRPYGWGIAEYSTPEQLFGDPLLEEAYRRAPGDSLRRMVTHLQSMLPDAEEEQILKFLK